MRRCGFRRMCVCLFVVMYACVFEFVLLGEGAICTCACVYM